VSEELVGRDESIGTDESIGADDPIGTGESFGADEGSGDALDGDVTELVRAAATGDRQALDELFEVVYGELKRRAASQRARWDGNDTLSTTVLVHEAFLKLVRQDRADWKDRAHFFATASRAMRHILVNYAERQRALKRGGDATRVDLDVSNPVPAESADDLIALDQALERLSRLHQRQSRVVECRFFGGLSNRETAEALGVSDSTVQRDWNFASAWLKQTLSA